MKRILRSLILGLSLFMLAGNAFAATPVYKLHVDGLACPFCSYGVEKQLSKLDGVARIDVDIKKGTVIVRLNEGATLDEATAKSAVKRAGFTLRAFERFEEAGAGN